MSATACRLGLHHWRRLWGETGPYRECRDCGTTTTGGKVAWQITGRTVVLAAMIVAVGVVALVLAILADAVFNNGPPANYRLGATAKCLRAHGYRVSHGSLDLGYPTILISRPRVGYLVTATFTAGEEAARDVVKADSDSIPEPRERNVVLANEGGPFPDYLDSCLATR
jgi:hypothetical protein